MHALMGGDGVGDGVGGGRFFLHPNVYSVGLHGYQLPVQGTEDGIHALMGGDGVGDGATVVTLSKPATLSSAPPRSFKRNTASSVVQIVLVCRPEESMITE